MSFARISYFRISSGNSDFVNLWFGKKSRKRAVSCVNVLMSLLQNYCLQLFGKLFGCLIFAGKCLFCFFPQSVPFYQLLKDFFPDDKCNVYSRQKIQETHCIFQEKFKSLIIILPRCKNRDHFNGLLIFCSMLMMYVCFYSGYRVGVELNIPFPFYMLYFFLWFYISTQLLPFINTQTQTNTYLHIHTQTCTLGFFKTTVKHAPCS